MTSHDGAVISYGSVGTGPGMIILGGVLSDAMDYLGLAEHLADEFEVHLVNRRGRQPSSPHSTSHSIEDEYSDVLAVAAATGASAVFGHSFGGLVALEAALRSDVFADIIVYEPGVPLRGQFDFSWMQDYERRLETGDRRGAFAWMVKRNGFTPQLAPAPMPLVKLIMRAAIRGRHWARMDSFLEANLIEHRVIQTLEALDGRRFAGVSARTVLLSGDKSPAFIAGPLVQEVAAAIPRGSARVVPGLDHIAPQKNPRAVAALVMTAMRVRNGIGT